MLDRHRELHLEVDLAARRARSIVRPMLRLLLACVLLVGGGWALATEIPGHHNAREVVIDGQLVATLRATVSGYSPDERAAIISDRLRDQLARLGSGVVTQVAAADGGMSFLIDGEPVLVLVPADALVVVGESLATASDRAKTTLERIIAERLRPISTEALWQRVLYICLMTLGYAMFIAGIIWLAIRLRRLLAYLGDLVAQRISQRELALIIREQITGLLRLLVVLAAWALGLIATSVWISGILVRFNVTREAGEQVRGLLGGWTINLLGNIAGALPGLGVVLVIGVITATLAHALRLLFERIERRRIQFGWLNADTAVPTRRLGTLALWLFAIAMAYPYLPGSDSEAFKGLSVLVGVMVSLGASGLVGQAASGFIVTYLGVIRSGDYVKVGETEGTVDHIGIFTTRIVTVFAESVSVPNVLILSNQLLNYSRSPGTAGVVLRAKVAIGYSVGWQEVHSMLLAAVVDDPALRHEPAPYVLQRTLSDFYVEYELCAHLIDPARRIPVLSAIQSRILDLARARGIQLLSPHWMANPPENPRPSTA